MRSLSEVAALMGLKASLRSIGYAELVDKDKDSVQMTSLVLLIWIALGIAVQAAVWLGILFWKHWQGYQAGRRYRKTVQTLNGLDDRTLHDIGVHRSEIESYAWTGGTGRYPERFATNTAFPRG